ncbi:MAG: hypothetical protein M1839_009120 [Geoglossum umbratile]|nr:MAG: hypothetical protein M1839_009120 [Geoglossum umbratile]
MESDLEKREAAVESAPAGSTNSSEEVEINESGHKQELQRNFSFFSILSTGIVVGNTWAALGGSLAVALYNGGPAGVIYEFIAVCFFYWFVAASIAELASAIPSSGGVYHWASVVAGKHGRIVGFFAGYWNFFAWLFASASISAIVGNQTVSMYLVYHPEVEPHPWQVFIAYEIACVLACCFVLFQNRLLPFLNRIGLMLILGGVFVTIVVCVAMTKQRAPREVVWSRFTDGTGYGNNGFVFLMGMLNGAYAIGTPDCISHLAEEIPRPASNLPKAIAAQMAVGFVTGLIYLIAIFYSISDLDTALQSSKAFPLVGIYQQATGSAGGAFGLTFIIFLPMCCCLIGCFITNGRTLWTLARDDATPCSGYLGKISPRWQNPFNATVVCGVLTSLLGIIYVGSTTAFNAIVGSFVLLSTISYLGAILPHLLSGRKNVTPGPFWMGKLGFFVNGVSVLYIMASVVIFSFPFVKPVAASNMNYVCVIVGGLTIITSAWWLVHGRKTYIGPVGHTSAKIHKYPSFYKL